MKRVILFVFFALTLSAQNTPVFPGAVASNSDLFIANNSAATTLTIGISSGATSATVASGTGFSHPSLVSIDNEILAVCGVSGNTLTFGRSACPNADGRGFDGTSAASHLTGHSVQGRVVAWQHNQAAAEIGAVETKLHNEMVSIKDFGVKGDGSTDDTSAIQTAINNAPAGGLFCPDATYIVSPSSYLMISLRDNLRLFGSSRCIFKVKNSAGPYNYVFKGGTCNNCSLEGFTIDANISNNAIANSGEIAAHIRAEIFISTARNTTVKGVTIKNTSSANPIVVGDGVALGDSANDSVTDCIIDQAGDDPNHVAHDSSGIFIWAANAVVTGNKIYAASYPNSPGAQSGIEAHGTNLNVANNSVFGYKLGLLIAGQDLADMTSVAVTGNTIVATYEGISLWSNTYSTHTSGYGFNGLNVTGNSVTVHQMAPSSLPNYASGIDFYTGSNLPSKNVHLDDNIVVFDLEGSVRGGAGNYASVGIGVAYVPSAGFTLTNFSVSGDTVENAPLSSIGANTAGGGALLTGRIEHNTLKNGGATQDVSITAAQRAAVFISSDSVRDVAVDFNSIVDDQATSTLTYMTRIYSASVANPDNEFLDNRVSIADVTHASWAGYFSIGSNYVVPLIRMTTLLPFSTPAATVKSGSFVWDTTIPSQYSLAATGTAWYLTPLVGRNLVGGDFALSGGWGTGASVFSVESGSKALEGIVTVNAGSAATSVYPTITLTFPSPPATLTAAPICHITRDDSATINNVGYTGIVSYTPSTTSLIFRLEDTPQVNTHYTIVWLCSVPH